MTTKNYYVCYTSKEGFQMWLRDFHMLFFAHHWVHALQFETLAAAKKQIESFKGRYRDEDLAMLYVASESGVAE